MSATPVIEFSAHNYISLDPNLDEQIRISVLSPNVIAGCFLFKKDKLDTLTVRRPHKALVITFTSGLYNTTRNLIADALTFKDDLVDKEDKIGGYFIAKLDTLTNTNLHGSVYVTVSLADLLSNTLEIEFLENK